MMRHYGSYTKCMMRPYVMHPTILSFVWTNQVSTWAGPVSHSARYLTWICIDGIEQQTNKISVNMDKQV